MIQGPLQCEHVGSVEDSSAGEPQPDLDELVALIEAERRWAVEEAFARVRPCRDEEKLQAHLRAIFNDIFPP